MDQTPVPPGGQYAFGTSELALADLRLALVLLNEGRHAALRRVFGMPREEANLLSAVLALAGTAAAYETARRIVRTPIPLTGADYATGAVLLRTAAAGVAGPGAAAMPGFGMLLGVAVVGGMAFPALRHGLHAAREAERRIRQHRILRYINARSLSPAAPAVTPTG